MTELTRDYLEILEKFGSPDMKSIPDHGNIKSYRGALPDPFLDFISLHGFGLWNKGYFQLCNPADFAGVLQLYLNNDEDFPASECYVLGYSAFGRMLVWSKRHMAFAINTAKAELTSTYWRRADPPSGNWVIADQLFMADDQINDMRDGSGAFLFSRAMKKLGRLSPGEVYGFKLAPQLGGQFTLENLAKKKAIEYFGMIAQMEPLRFMDYSTPQPKVVRLIGR